MDVTLECRGCASPVGIPAAAIAAGVARCTACEREHPIMGGEPDGRLGRCLVCGEHRLYRQKDLDRRVGALVVLGSAAVSLALLPFSPPAAYGVLGLLALVDWALYRRLPEVVLCYRCKAQHRGYGECAAEPFDLLTAEIVDNKEREERERRGDGRTS